MIVGITGHRFYDEPTASFLARAVRELLTSWAAEELRVVSSLAEERTSSWRASPSSWVFLSMR